MAAASRVTISGTGKVLLSDVSADKVGRLLVHIPASATISMTFVGRPRDVNRAGTENLSASDDVSLGYYTPISDTIASGAVISGQVHVKADGNLVYANVASGTFPVTVTILPLEG